MYSRNLYNKAKIYNMLNIIKHNSLVLFNYIIREIGSTNITLRYLPLEVTNKRFGKKKALFNYFDGS